MKKNALRVVSGVLFDAEFRVLMGLRKRTGKRPLLWELPGGKVEDAEAPSWALMREWREEVGIDVLHGVYVTSASLDLEVPLLVELHELQPLHKGYDVPIRPQALDHEQLAWVDPLYAIAHLPCSPAFYMHWAGLRAYIARLHDQKRQSPIGACRDQACQSCAWLFEAPRVRFHVIATSEEKRA